MIGVNNCHSVSFLHAGGTSAGVRMELKICEGFGCGRYFYRRVPELGQSADALCPKCVARALKRPPQRSAPTRVLRW